MLKVEGSFRRSHRLDMSLTNEDCEQTLRRGLQMPGNAFREVHWEEAFHYAVNSGLNHWASLFRALNLIAAEKYGPVIERLLAKAQRDGDWVYREYGNFFIHGVLLARAYYWRRLAKPSYELLMRFLRPHRVGEIIPFLAELPRHSELLNKYAQAALNIYSELTDVDKPGVDPLARAVSHHGLAAIEPSVRYPEFEAARSKEQRVDLRPLWAFQERHYVKAIELAENAGFVVPASHARLAGLAINRWRALEKNDRFSKQGEGLLAVAQTYAESSLEATKRILDARSYLPPLLDLAFTKYALALISGTEEPLQQASADLNAAMMSAPFDRTAWETYSSYVSALADSVVNPSTHQLYLNAKLVFPTEPIVDQLQTAVTVSPAPSLKATNLNTLIILKRWSSYSPLLVNNRSHRTLGGGYLLNWEGKYIAIDPGVGFIESMNEYGLTVGDLDAVAITHDHIDHQREMEPLLALMGEYNNRFSSSPPPTPHVIHFFFSRSSYYRWPSRRFRKPFSVLKPTIHRVDPTRRAIHLFGGQVRVRTIPTYGHYDVGDFAARRNDLASRGSGVGYIFELRRHGTIVCTLGITGDTAYGDESGQTISESYKDCDIVIAHTSTTADVDHRNASKLIRIPGVVEPVDGFNGFYKKHLGFWGTVSFVRDLFEQPFRNAHKPLILLSEFGEEFLPIRLTVAEEVWRKVRSTVSPELVGPIVASDVGTRVSLDRKCVLCQVGKACPLEASCENGVPIPTEIILDEVDPRISHQGWRDRQIVYLCGTHQWLTEHPDYRVFL
jgi:hypothetical protein